MRLLFGSRWSKSVKPARVKSPNGTLTGDVSPFRRTLILIRLRRITFTVFFVPAPCICLASYVTALAVKADAFDPSVDSVETLLQRPNLEGTDWLPLKWKKKFENEDIFKIDDDTFRRIWHQGWLALGARDSNRPYTLRVGVGMDLDGTLAGPSSYYNSCLLLTMALYRTRRSR